MTAKIYYDLREQLDQYSVGFPSTESGVELKILEAIFTEEEAEMYLNLSMMLETPQQIAERIGRDPEQVSQLLERMVDKGQIFRMRKGDVRKYGAAPFVVGSYEYQVKNMDRNFAELFEKYFNEAFGKQGLSQSAPLRTVPVNKTIDHRWAVAPYEDLKEIIKSKDTISVGKCVCRTQQKLLDKGCGKPLEACLQFGSHAHFYVEKGMGRYISQDEALEILEKCDEAGLVPQPFVSQDTGGICNCCGDCCGILRSIKLHPKPADKVLANYHAQADPETCSSCGTCLDRCQMDAITLEEGATAQVDRDRCIGCGLCVTTCPTESMSLKMKPESERKQPPATGRDYVMQLASARGRSLIPLSIIKKS
ncbi:MAG: 4Fe-4S binding protein [Desulfomonilaceae bacterium]